MGVEMKVVYVGDLGTEMTHGPSGAKVITDAPLDNGGKGRSFSPTDFASSALAACMLTIMGKVAAAEGVALEGTEVTVVKDMVADPVRRIGSLKVSMKMSAGCAGLTDLQKKKLVDAAMTCPVKESLHPGIEIVFEAIWP